MAYYLDLLSPETYKAFSEPPRDISGFRPRQREAAQGVKIGDKLVCYVKRISRWLGFLEMTRSPFEYSAPRSYSHDDPFAIRFTVRSMVWSPSEMAMHEDILWNPLSPTRSHDKRASAWTGFLRNSVRRLTNSDSKTSEDMLVSQSQRNRPRLYSLSEEDNGRLRPVKIRTQDNAEAAATVPEDGEQLVLAAADDTSFRESRKMEAIMAELASARGSEY